MSAYNQGQENYYVDRGLTPLQPDMIEKLKLQANIILGDFIFNTIDEFGVVWVVTDIEGWWEMPSAEMPNIPRGFGDGSYDVQGRYNARDLVLKGTFLVQQPSQVEAARDRLVAACDLVYKGAWLKTGNDPIRASFVRLSGGIRVNTSNPRGRTDFEIGLRAADPIKYSWNDASPDGYTVSEIPAKNISVGYDGIGNITNIGNYPVPTILEITGPLVSPATIYNRTTDKLILVTQSLKGSITRAVVNKQLVFNTTKLVDVATLTTTAKHDFSVGDSVYVSNVGFPFDGQHIITSAPTDTTFTYEPESAVVREVVSKSLANSVATIETSLPHGFGNGDPVTISGVDDLFNGNYSIISVPNENSFTFSKTRVPPQTVTGKVIVSNIATLTTQNNHQFIIGDNVAVSGVGVPFDGSYTITSIPSSNQFSYAATRTNALEVVSKSLTDRQAMLTTAAAHGFVVGESVSVSGVDSYFNGNYVITQIPSSTQFTYEKVSSNRRSLSVKSITSNTAVLTTTAPHNFLVGEQVRVVSSDADFDGFFTITAVPSTTTFAFALTKPNLVPTQILTSDFVEPFSRKVKSFARTGNIATITTTSPHGYFVGATLNVQTVNPEVNGGQTVASIVNANTFTFVDSGSDIASSEIPSGFVSTSGVISETAVSPSGIATVSGSLPFSGASGTASVSDTIPKTQASGKAIKKNDIIFTPGIQNATAVLSADILEIDTKNREVAFNGEVEGARGRIDVLADFIELAPGQNQLEFNDEGNLDSGASLRIYYRSGWLG
jgi:hypothetical protein